MVSATPLQGSLRCASPACKAGRATAGAGPARCLSETETEQTVNEIVRHEGVKLDWRAIGSMSKVLSEARGFVPRDMVGQPHAIAAAILTGQELGIGPMQSLRSVHVIDGRPTIGADLMLALAIRAGVRHQWIESTEQVARLRLTREGFEPHEHTFSIREAQAARLTGKGNWQKYPAAMLRARCLSAALRAFCPDVLGSGVYVEGEIDDERGQREPDRLPLSSQDPPVDVMDAVPEPDPEAPPIAEQVRQCLDAEGLEGARALANMLRPRMSQRERDGIRTLLTAAAEMSRPDENDDANTMEAAQ